MRFNLISNLANGVGLEQDYKLLRHELERREHVVHGVQFNAKPLQAPQADVNIFLETVVPEIFRAAHVQWAIPHPEWWFEGWNQYAYDAVLAKTRDCEQIFTARFGKEVCRYIGWLSRDLYNPDIPRERKFLHVAGKSKFKNTAAVQLGCQLAQVPLTVITAQNRVTDKELRFLMNSHFCHIMPSAYEGYGHALHEALGAGQILITTNAPPMNENSPALLVPSSNKTRHHSGILHSVEAEEIAKAIQLVMKFSLAEIAEWSEIARNQFLKQGQAFQDAFNALLTTLYA